MALLPAESRRGGLGDVGAGDLRGGQHVRDRLQRAVGDGLDRGPDPLVLAGSDRERMPIGGGDGDYWSGQ